MYKSQEGTSKVDSCLLLICTLDHYLFQHGQNLLRILLNCTLASQKLRKELHLQVRTTNFILRNCFFSIVIFVCRVTWQVDQMYLQWFLQKVPQVKAGSAKFISEKRLLKFVKITTFHKPMSMFDKLFILEVGWIRVGPVIKFNSTYL